MKPVVGIFVGGSGKRMGGVHKGLLEVDGVPLAQRTCALGRAVADEVVLVGRAEAYASLGLHAVADAETGTGPLGGLVGLLRYAGKRHAVALACDLPFLSASLLARLCEEAPEAPVLSPRSGPLWNPLFARYDAERCLPVAAAQLEAGTLSLQPLLRRLDARELPLDDTERAALRDWDRPEDMT